MLQRESIVGVLLAGGQSRRLGGGDKCLRNLGKSTLLARAQERAGPQVGTLILSANGDHGRFHAAGLPVVADLDPAHGGPLAGLLSALVWAASMRPAATHVATFATDTPFFPRDLVQKLSDALNAEAPAAVAARGARAHPAFGLWPVAARGALQAFLDGGERRAAAWISVQKARPVSFDTGPDDPFFNINTPDDLAAAEELAVRFSD